MQKSMIKNFNFNSDSDDGSFDFFDESEMGSEEAEIVELMPKKPKIKFNFSIAS